jgi:hypothetical protein
MADDRCVQPRQIYASTLTRRDRRWTRRRGRGIRSTAVVVICALVAAVTVVAAVSPVLS